jgi:hypothetical protein
MSNPIAKHAVVIGAGMGGLAAAKALAPYFEKVTVLDRDALPEVLVARTGTPQARHAHALLAGGQKALETLFPGIEGDIAKAGAVKVRVGRDVIWERPGFDPFPPARPRLRFVLPVASPARERVPATPAGGAERGHSASHARVGGHSLLRSLRCGRRAV